VLCERAPELPQVQNDPALGSNCSVKEAPQGFGSKNSKSADCIPMQWSADACHSRFSTRVAPLFNWCSKVLLFNEGALDSTSYEEIALTEATDCFERLNLLQRKEVTTLVCGALSADLLYYAEDLKVRVICGVAGGISDVLDGYKKHKLNQPLFRLPECLCKRRFSETQRGSTMIVGQGRDLGQGQGKGRGKE
jgi:hypothetical protein